MKKSSKIFVVLLFFFPIFLFSQCADEQNIYKFSFNGEKYEIVKEMRTWENAAQCAVERGGYLVEINSKEEQDTIYKAILAAGIPKNYTQVPDGGGTAYIWIGATDKEQEGKWIWDGKNQGKGINFWTGQGTAGANNGQIINDSYVNWGGASTGTFHEPDNYNNSQNAAAIALDGWPLGSTLLGSPGEWNDINENNTLYYIIEIDNNSGVLENEFKTNPIFSFNSFSNNCIISNLQQNSQISLFDFLGNNILNYYNKNTNPEVSLDLKDIASGLYFVLIKGKTNNNYFYKFLKN
jgi:hypothetical protein